MSNALTETKQSFRGEAALILRQAWTVWNLLTPGFKRRFLLACVVMAAISGCNTAFPMCLGRMIDHLQANLDQGAASTDSYRLLTRFLLYLAAIFAVREVLQVARAFLVEDTCTRIEKAMTVRAAGHLMKADLLELSHEKIGALHGRLSRSVVGYVRFIRLAFLDFLPPVLTGVFALTAALFKQPMLALTMAAVVPLSFYLTLRQLTSQKGIRLSLMRDREDMDGIIIEQLGAVESVRAANAHDREVKRVARAAEQRRKRESKHLFAMALFSSGKALNEAFFHLLVLGVTAFYAIQGTVSVGDILTFSMLFANVMAPLNVIHRALDEGHECSLMVGDLLQILDKPADRSFHAAAEREPALAPKKPLVEVRDLCVEYVNGTGIKRALNGVCATIHHGETIGIAGPTGSGKSTLIKVLLRLTHPTSGYVTIGEVPVDSISREVIGRLFGYVSQNPFVFAGTIEDNIRYGRPDATRQEIEMAARRACLHEEILQLPDGYQGQVLERGSNLSGGQRQRLALARLFLQDPPILILDEGTSALDNINERNVQRAIDLARQDRTVIIVAHRLSTIKDADRIYVFHQGCIAETGSYHDLCVKNGIFTELVKCAQTVA